MSSSGPEISIVIPTCNRPELLTVALEQLKPERQAVAPNTFEVVVTDDSTGDATERMMRVRFPDLRYTRGPRLGPGPNRNVGAAIARGRWLAFVDDDCRPADDYVHNLQEAIRTSGADVIEGAILASKTIDSPFCHSVETLSGGGFWTGNLAVRRAVFVELNGFDADLAAGEDMEFGHRVCRAGIPTTFCRNIEVVHQIHTVGWRYLLHAEFRIRWHLLYALKVGDAPPVDTPAWKAVMYMVVNRTANLLRTTRRAIVAPDASRPKSTRFHVALTWLLFPILLPYLAYWDLRFRRMLRDR